MVGIETNPGPGDFVNRVSEEKRWTIIFMHKRMKNTPYKIAQSLKMNEQTVHNTLLRNIKKQGLFTIYPNREENGSFPTNKFNKLFAKLKKERLLLKSLENVKLK